jgi:hypothetical protein
MRHWSGLRGGRLAAVTGALAVAAGGLAWAAIPASDGAVHTCYQRASGDLRAVNDPSACRRFETPLDLGGPTRGYAFGGTGDVALRATSVTVADLRLPAGTYLVHGKVNLFDDAFGDAGGAFVPCDLRLEGTTTMLDQNAVRLEGPVSGTEANISDEALQTPLAATAPAHVLLECAALPSTGTTVSVRARYRQLDAVQLDGLTAAVAAPTAGGEARSR